MQPCSYFLVSRNWKTLNGALSWIVVNGIWYQLLFEYVLCKLLSIMLQGLSVENETVHSIYLIFFLGNGCTWSQSNGKRLPYEFRDSLGVQCSSVIQDMHATALTEHEMSSLSFCHNKCPFVLLEFTVFSMYLAAIFAWYKWVFPKWYSMEHWVSAKEKKSVLQANYIAV